MRELYKIGEYALLLKEYSCLGTVHMEVNSVHEILDVSDRCVALRHPETGAQVWFTFSEAMPHFPVAKTKATRFYRVSAFPVGFNSIKTQCAIHKASRNPAIAYRHYLKLCQQIGEKFGAVLFHQGNLKWDSHKVIARVDAEAALP